MARLLTVAAWLKATNEELDGVDPATPYGRFLRARIHELERVAADDPNGLSAIIKPQSLAKYYEWAWDW